LSNCAARARLASLRFCQAIAATIISGATNFGLVLQVLEHAADMKVSKLLVVPCNIGVAELDGDLVISVCEGV
jgi:hypothetical protein